MAMLSILLGVSLSAGSELSSVEKLLDLERYRSHVRFLAAEDLEGRGTGSQGQKAAATYIAAQFRKCGLEPAGDEGTYFQRFEARIPAFPTVDKESYVKVQTTEGIETLEGKQFQPFAFSANAEAQGPLVFVGYSISSEALKYDDYAGVDVKGKVALCLRHSPAEAKPESPFGPLQMQVATFVNKAKAAAAAGAAALLLVHDTNHKEDQFVAPAAGGEPSPIPVVQVERAVAERILKGAGRDLAALQKGIDGALKPNSFEVAGAEVSLKVQVGRSRRGSAPTENVVGLLRGSDPVLSRECVVVGGHYDHAGFGGSGASDRGRIHYGADDNASGTAAVLEIARALSQLEPRPKRSLVLIAFSAEELGLYGSAHYVKHPSCPIEKTVGMINLDMVGRSKEGYCEVSGVGTAEGLEGMVGELNEGIELSLKLEPKVSTDSDHYNFARAKVPILFFFTGFHADYHQPTDTWEKINAEDALRVTRLALRAAYAFASRETRFEFRSKKGKR